MEFVEDQDQEVLVDVIVFCSSESVIEEDSVPELIVDVEDGDMVLELELVISMPVCDMLDEELVEPPVAVEVLVMLEEVLLDENVDVEEEPAMLLVVAAFETRTAPTNPGPVSGVI